MPARARLTARARAEVSEAVRWIAKDNAAAARGVAMLHLAAIDNRHSLEPAVRVGAYPAPLFRGGKILRPGIVQQQKR